MIVIHHYCNTRRIRAVWDAKTSKAAAAMFSLEVALRLGYQNVHLFKLSLSSTQAALGMYVKKYVWSLSP